MDSQGMNKIEDLEAAETPEDVAVLYSWANLHGAKYRDFSASRREYRAQLRQRASDGSEQVSPSVVEGGAMIETGTSTNPGSMPVEREASVDVFRDAAAHDAASQRLDAARRAEALAVAEAAARREEREIAEAHAAAQREADLYVDSESRRRAQASQPSSQPSPLSYAELLREERSSQQSVPSLEEVRPNRYRRADEASAAATRTEPAGTVPASSMLRRPQGYHPDDASGVRQIYRGTDLDASHLEASREGNSGSGRDRRASSGRDQSPSPAEPIQDTRSIPESMYTYRPSSVSYKIPAVNSDRRHADAPFQPERRASRREAEGPWPTSVEGQTEGVSDPGFAGRRDDLMAQSHQNHSVQPPVRHATSFSQNLTPPDSVRGRRAQDDFDYKQASVSPDPVQRKGSEPTIEAPRALSSRQPFAADPAGPAWLYAPATPPPAPQKPVAAQSPPVPQSSVADTLQHSRERVASRWYALKGVFDQPGQEQGDAAPVRQKETRTPILAVFSLAGGVGKTSLVATVGRALSSLGEKVLLTDTTSHGLLPFYFGASELRQGTVRTFSPPSGSTDAPIYLVSYDIEQSGRDEAAQEQLVEEIVNNSRGTHRILLDLNTNSSWIVRRMARMSPTILVPVAPDMNSVISLQAVERYFNGVVDADGRPIQPFYVLNQFDTSLPLHLDVREVLRRQLGDRLLPSVIRRAPAVSEALAEGMTVVDYVPDAPVAEDYVQLATWLRTIAAPATAGFRNVRWSER